MTIFSQRITSTDRIAVPAERLWAVLRDPDMLAELTPLVDRVDVDGTRWRWTLSSVTGVGITAAPSFTTVMTFHQRGIAFAPEPQTDDRATATGGLLVNADGPAHTELAIDLTASVDLPLPEFAARAVRRVMFTTMRAGGSRFANNLLSYLGDPAHRGLDVRRPATDGPPLFEVANA